MNEDPDLPDDERGLYPKYRVFKRASEDMDHSIHDIEVIDPGFFLKFKDPFAKEALLAYANACDEKYPKLADDIRQKLHEVNLEELKTKLMGNQGKIARDYEGHLIGEDGLVDGPGGQRLKPVEDPWPAINARRQEEGSA